MSIDWFSPSQRRRSANDTIKPSYNGSVPEDNETGRPSMQRAITAPLSTPHDAVLSVFSMLSGAPRDADGDVSNSNGQRNPTSISAVPMTRDTSGEDASTQEPGSIQGIRTAAATPSAAPNPFSGGVEHVYDPFTGNMAGVLYPRPPDQSTSSSANDTESKKKDSLQFDQAKDDLWSHLARIRDLQSEIASMHGNMEGIGLNDGGRSGQKRPAHPTTRMHTDTIGAGEEWVDAEQEAKEREKARDAEFVKLAESFEGRRGAIDGIVNKVRQ
ncbi:hypothetical protein BXZ70DRAFT_929042 [Cristinia sonorae]|uniref:Uncharacterized protein n=1 Tax=Cristinia sonorae TaxID=1940300 RepID=A0A8K0XRR0_9AGAR|nr:hypothetical protein BXZ70DRAFT_929042 [Cristinia sonorae]